MSRPWNREVGAEWDEDGYVASFEPPADTTSHKHGCMCEACCHAALSTPGAIKRREMERAEREAFKLRWNGTNWIDESGAIVGRK